MGREKEKLSADCIEQINKYVDNLGEVIVPAGTKQIPSHFVGAVKTEFLQSIVGLPTSQHSAALTMARRKRTEAAFWQYPSGMKVSLSELKVRFLIMYHEWFFN